MGAAGRLSRLTGAAGLRGPGGSGGAEVGLGGRLNPADPAPGDPTDPAPRGGVLRWRGARPRGSATDDSGFIAAVTQVSGALRSGIAPAEAWWRGMGVRADAGVPDWPDLLHRWPDDAAGARAVFAAARLAAEVGAAPATVLDRVAHALAQDAEAQGQRRAALAGPRATARVLAWLPALGLVLGLALGADPFAVLLDGAGGSALLVAGAVLTWVGRRWTGRHLRAAYLAGRER